MELTKYFDESVAKYLKLFLNVLNESPDDQLFKKLLIEWIESRASIKRKESKSISYKHLVYNMANNGKKEMLEMVNTESSTFQMIL